MKQVLVTGAAGFCGRHLVTYLVQKGNRVTGTAWRRTPASSPHDCDLTFLDFRHALKVDQLIRRTKPDVVYHLAAQSVPRFSWEREAETMETNAAGTIYLLEALRRHQPNARILFASTNQVYGQTFRRGKPVEETDLLWPESPYAASKVVAELACQDFARRFGTDVVIARPFNHLGTGQEAHFVFSDWCRQIALAEAGKRAPVLEVGNLEARRDFLHVDDVVRAYEILIHRGKRGRCYNIGTGKVRPLSDYIDFLLKQARVSLTVKVRAARLRLVDPPAMKTSPAEIQKLGWRPRQSAFQALRELLEEWREKIG